MCRNWLQSNLSNPYPTFREKAYLANQTKLTIKQIDGWFKFERSKLGIKKRKPKTLRSKLISQEDGSR